MPAVQIVYSEGGVDQQRRSMDAINKVFVPLNGTPVYKDRVVILCDQPTEVARRDFEVFRNAYRSLETNGQLHVSSVQSLEEYYPHPWKNTADQVAQLRRQKGIKTQIAITVGQAISQEAFEREMPVFKAALDNCWRLAHQ